jgi:hypothetical protein
MDSQVIAWNFPHSESQVLPIDGEDPVVVNFLCQLDLAKGCPDSWGNIILGVSVRVFLEEISI